MLNNTSIPDLLDQNEMEYKIIRNRILDRESNTT